MVMITVVLMIVVILFMAWSNSQQGALVTEEASSGDMTYETLNEMNVKTATMMALPSAATDASYSSTAPDGKITVRVDYTYNGYTCWCIEKTTMAWEDITGIEKDWTETFTYRDSNNLEWTISYDDTEGLALAYDAANGWTMKAIDAQGPNMGKDVMTDIIDETAVNFKEQIEARQQTAQESFTL